MLEGKTQRLCPSQTLETLAGFLNTLFNFEKIQKFNDAVNLEMGYKQVLIYSPREVTTYMASESR